MTQVTVIATIKAKAGRSDQFRAELLSLIEPTRSEAGCINYDLHQMTDDANCFVFYENWKSKEDLDQHLATPYISAFIGKADELLSEPVDIKLLDIVSD
jgi:quinol monooxygenase YgiN